MKTQNNTTPEWYAHLSNFWVNSVAISDKATRVVAGTFFHDYTKKGTGPNQPGRFGTYCYDGKGTQVWKDEFEGMDGVFAVAVSGKGDVAAAGGWYSQNQALLRAYDSGSGAQLLDYTQIQKRVSCVALSEEGDVLAAAADDVYLFVRQGGAFPAAPEKMGISASANGFVTSVAVEPGGRWLVACDLMGNVHLGTIEKGKIEKTYQWTAPQEPVDRNNPASAKAPVPFLAVQISKQSRAFAAGGGDMVYRLTLDGMRQGKGAIGFDTWDAQAPTGPTSKGTAQENVRWVSISGDGTFLAAVANRLGPDPNNGTGLLVALSLQNGKLTRAWNQNLARNPNSTSMNAAGSYVSVADGYPLGTASQLYLFDGNGKTVWTYPTTNMNWPMVVSAFGSKIAAGGDDGNLYYLNEKAPKSKRPRQSAQAVT